MTLAHAPSINKQGQQHYSREIAHPLSAEILCILQSLSPMDSTLVSKALSTSVSGRASWKTMVTVNTGEEIVNRMQVSQVYPAC